MKEFKNKKTGEIITEAEYITRFGKPNFSTAKQTLTQEKPGYLSRVGSTIKNNLDEGVQSQKNSMDGSMHPLRAGINIAKNISGAAAAPLAEIPGIKQIGEFFNKTGQAIVDTKIGNKFTDTLAKSFSPETLGTTSDLLESGLNVLTVESGFAGVRKGLTTTKNSVNAVIDTTKNTFNKIGANSPKSLLESAIKDATPDYESLSLTKKQKYLDRVEEGGFLEGRNIKPDNLNIEAGTELSKVPGYDPNGTKLSKYQVTKAEISKRGKVFKESLKNEKQLVPKRETAKVAIDAINKVPEKSLLLQASDPILKNYVRVLKNALVKEPGNLLGVQELIEILDDAYENARGSNKAFNSDTLNALDEVHKASRDALTKYLIEKAKSTDVKVEKRRLWNLYRALDELRVSASKESGSSVGRTMQKHPIGTKIIKSAANATGVGGAVNLMTEN